MNFREKATLASVVWFPVVGQDNNVRSDTAAKLIGWCAEYSILSIKPGVISCLEHDYLEVKKKL